MFADSNELELSYFLLYFIWVGGKGTLFDGCGGHGDGESSEVEVGDVTLEPLEKWVLSEKAIELIPPGLPLQQNMVAVAVALLLHLGSNGIRKHSFPSPKLNIDKLRSN